MTRPRNLALIAAGLLLLALLAIVVSGAVLPTDYPTRQTAARAFTLDVDFTQVRKILVRTGGAKQIIKMAGDSEFLDEHWAEVGARLDSLNLLDPAWRLDLSGTLKVRSLDDYVGRPVVTLAQEVKITPDQVLSTVKQTERTQRLWAYDMTTTFQREKTATTRVELTLTQEILTTAPWYGRWIADRRVRDSAARALANQETAIRKLIEENRHKTWILPF